MPRLALDEEGNLVQALSPGTTQTQTYTGTAGVIGNAISATEVVRIVATTDCFIVFGSSPTATTSHMFVLANQPEYFRVSDDGTDKVSAIRSSEDGSIYVTEML